MQAQQFLSIDQALERIEDSNLQQCIQSQTAGQATAGDVLRIDCNHQNIQSASGLQAFVNLEELYLRDKQFCDLTPLTVLTSLRVLELDWGSRCIKDISALTGLKQLERLNLHGNDVQDLVAAGEYAQTAQASTLATTISLAYRPSAR